MRNNEILVLLLMTVMLGALAACAGSDDDDSAVDGSEPDDSGTEIAPMEGDWTFGSGTWLSDECQATFLSSAIGWVLSNATETGFDLSIQFAESGSMPAEPECTLSSSDYVCDPVLQQFSIGANSITLEATAQGSFSSDNAASLEVSFDIACSGSGCDGMLSANPCTSVQSFNVFFDG